MYDARNENGTGRKDGSRGNPLVRQVLAWCEVLTCKAANLIIATNGSYKQLEMERSGISENRIHIVRNGPDPAAFHPVATDAELRTKGKTLLGYVGIMGPQDGVDYALRALAHLRHTLKRDDFYAIFIGKGEMLPELKKQVVELGLADNVRFTGRIPYADLLRYLSSVDICLGPDPGNDFTSRSTMIKMMEYMAMHKPIVAFDLVEHRVSAGDAALYAPANDEAAFAQHVQTLMDDPAQRQHMGELGYARIVNGLAWPFQAQKLLEAYVALGVREAKSSVYVGDRAIRQ
jgi:glycosyltransferase involved in cell wall biosynthesis